MSTSLSCATAPPLPVTGGGAAVQSPTQAPVQGGGIVAPATSVVAPTPAPVAPTVSTQAATSGAALVQPAVAAPAVAVAPPVGAQPAPPVAAPVAPAVVAPAPTTGGGSTDTVTPLMNQLTQDVAALGTAIQAAQSGAGGVTGGGAAGSGIPAAVCCCKHGGGMQAYAAGARTGRKGTMRGANGGIKAAGAGGSLDDKHTIKGQKMSSAQRKNIEAVLKQGQKMGASQKVLEAAVATVIQESNAENIKGGDRDSVGLFQQRPSMGWGSAEQVGNPKYAAKKFFEKAIPADKKDPGQAKTALAQSVQRSAFPDAYAQWDKEAESIVADFMR